MISASALETRPGTGEGSIFFLLLGLAYLGAIIWTYQDATERSDQSPTLWALAVVLAPPLGVVLYLLLGRTR
ncbi:PLDc N-terminal domain-containing protein [Natrarchaeobaculum aegyptiacum]|uniref:Cardiolipin synthase N-terminal domain-containing protein n=1 Tax=Natrarchaeobaculum aegyptiacum TaxID=745377 RepID=A0A2Z2HTY6_9EURY|nr:PLDc N-terminal domain-containing protein [Natrarchaeobaculum aegyptiacum]ARS88897.1 hypothetical protein B1756_03435 [Natrarchaeobaculum aegyptiacum]